MICDQDLFDSSAAFVRIRGNVLDSNNKDIVEKIIDVLTNNQGTDNTFSFNKVRKAISTIESLDKDIWDFVYHENVYVHYSMLKNDSIYNLLIKACELLKQAIEEGVEEKMDNLVDAIHCLPDIIAENNMKIPKSYWKSHIKYYRDKWDKNFLKEEQRSLY